MSKNTSKLNLAGVHHVPDVCMGMHIRRASRIVTQIYDAALRPAGLAINQFTLLVAIYLVESVPVTQLAQELITDQTTLTRNLKVLEKRGLVTIEPGRDRRIRLVSLTAEGHAVWPRHSHFGNKPKPKCSNSSARKNGNSYCHC